ncbi:MAG: hypothetical protein DRJ03_01205 [Chloroflexi bacterium]|nr:MAG: hypothetical protein DRJ03_01205 [Chloroflexota bacterium]
MDQLINTKAILDSDIINLKECLYDILMAEEEKPDNTPDINAIQNLGVSMTRAVQKDGVNIFQLQSVRSHKVTLNVVKALKLLDNASAPPAPVLLEAPPEEEKVDVVFEKEKALRMLLVDWADSRTSLNTVLESIKQLYITEVTRRYETQAEAARHLGVSRGYIGQLQNKYNIKQFEQEDLV